MKITRGLALTMGFATLSGAAAETAKGEGVDGHILIFNPRVAPAMRQVPGTQIESLKSDARTPSPAPSPDFWPTRDQSERVFSQLKFLSAYAQHANLKAFAKDQLVARAALPKQTPADFERLYPGFTDEQARLTIDAAKEILGPSRHR